MARILLISVLLAGLGNFSWADEWVGVNGRTIRLNKSTKCTELATTKMQDVCDCCLLKYTMAHGATNKDALAACRAKNMCRKDTGISASQAVRDARKNLSPLDIVNIETLRAPPSLPADGELDSEAVINILRSLSRQGYIPVVRQLMSQHIETPCLKVKPLGDGVKGIHTGQLFRITMNMACLETDSAGHKEDWQGLYILKESKKGWAELYNLYRVRMSPLGAEYVPTTQLIREDNLSPSSPAARITFEDLHFKFGSGSQTRYFSLLQMAKGKSLQDHLRSFGEKMADPNLSTEDRYREIFLMKTMFFRTGHAMSKLHQKYATQNLKKAQIIGKTYIHGDFHAQNVFFDPSSNDVTLIDNETFSLSLRKRTSGVNDIVDIYLLHTVKTVAHLVSKQLMTNLDLGIGDTMWHEFWHDLFWGYLSAYDFQDPADMQDAYWEFRAKFYEGLSNSQLFDSIKNFKDQRMLKRFGPSFRRFWVREHHLDRAFLDLQKTLRIKNVPRSRPIVMPGA